MRTSAFLLSCHPGLCSYRAPREFYPLILINVLNRSRLLSPKSLFRKTLTFSEPVDIACLRALGAESEGTSIALTGGNFLGNSGHL